MNVQLSSDVTIDPAAAEFVEGHHAQPALETAYGIIRSIFPELRSIHVQILDDPDEEGHTWVVLHVKMPAPPANPAWSPQLECCYQELDRQLPLPYHPFSLSVQLHS